MSNDNFVILPDGFLDITISDKVLFRTANEFSMFVTNTARKNGKSVTQTILDYIDERDLEPEHIKKLISSPLKDLIALEMREAGLLLVDSTAAFDEYH